MRWLSETCVHLRCDELINVNYRYHQATLGQFSVLKPYQAPALSQPSSGFHTEVDVPDKHHSIADHDRAHLTPSSTPVPAEPLPGDSSTRPFKRRRQGQSDLQAESRQGEAQQRHDARKLSLLSAYQLFQHFLQNTDSSKAAIQSAGAPSLQCCHASEDSNMQGKDTLNLLALHELKYTLRPKFAFVVEEDTHADPVNLFDNLICNDSNQEQIGDAFGHKVVIPAQAAFLLSDIKKLSPLMTGLHCTDALVTTALTDIAYRASISIQQCH